MNLHIVKSFILLLPVLFQHVHDIQHQQKMNQNLNPESFQNIGPDTLDITVNQEKLIVNTFIHKENAIALN